MYREYVFSCIDRALEETKKDSPKLFIGFLIIGALLSINGITLIAFGAGVKLLFMDPAGCGVLSLLCGLVALYAAILFAKDLIKSRLSNASAKEKEKYLQMVRALGDEKAVFRFIDTLSPVKCGDCELRYNKSIIACASASNLSSNFMYPLSLLTNIGTGALGSEPYMFMHFMVNGRKLKKSVHCTPDEADSIIRQLVTYNPNIHIGAK